MNTKKKHREQSPQFQKYKLPKRFTKIKWNSTWPTRSARGERTERNKRKEIWTIQLYRPSLSIRDAHILYASFGFCWWLWHPQPTFLTVIYHWKFCTNCSDNTKTKTNGGRWVREREREPAHCTLLLLMEGTGTISPCNLWHVCLLSSSLLSLPHQHIPYCVCIYELWPR